MMILETQDKNTNRDRVLWLLWLAGMPQGKLLLHVLINNAR